MKKFILSLFVCASICCQIFASTPLISGPFVLCDSAFYSLQNVPDNATIEWSYINPSNTSSMMNIPLRIGSGQGTKRVCLKRGIQIQTGSGGFIQPDFPFEPVSLESNIVESNALQTFVPYEGFVTIKATAIFNNTTYTVTKEIYMPEKVEINTQGMGFANPWEPGVTKVITLASPLDSRIQANIEWEVDIICNGIGGSHLSGSGKSIGITAPLNATTISITATNTAGCDDEYRTSTIVIPVSNGFIMTFTNPASGNVEINVLEDGVSDSNMRTISNQEPYMGAYRLELWHDLHGKVREIDVAENTPTVTMNLDGLSSGVYILRLIIDNQIITAEQLIVK